MKFKTFLNRNVRFDYAGIVFAQGNRPKSEKITKLTLNSFRKLSKKSSLFESIGISSNRLKSPKVSICLACARKFFVWRENSFYNLKNLPEFSSEISYQKRCASHSDAFWLRTSESKTSEQLEELVDAQNLCDAHRQPNSVALNLGILKMPYQRYQPFRTVANFRWSIFGGIQKHSESLCVGSLNFLMIFWDCPLAQFASAKLLPTGMLNSY